MCSRMPPSQRQGQPEHNAGDSSNNISREMLLPLQGTGGAHMPGCGDAVHNTVAADMKVAASSVAVQMYVTTPGSKVACACWHCNNVLVP